MTHRRLADSGNAGITTWHRLIPAVAMFIYLNITVLLFAFGPWPWPVREPWLLYGFLVAAHLALLGGYLSGAFKPLPASDAHVPFRRMLWISLVLTAILLVPTIMVNTGGSVDVLRSYENPGEVYLEAQQLEREANNPLSYIRFFLGPLLVLLFPLSVLYWDELSRTQKVLSFLTIIGGVIGWMLVGKNKGLADILIVLPWLLIGRAIRHNKPMNLKRGLVWATGIALLAMLFLTLFYRGQVERSGRRREITKSFREVPVHAYRNGPLLDQLSPENQGIYRGLSVYLTGGYYGLSLALEKPFVWTYGVGHSMFLHYRMDRLLGEPIISDRSYVGRNDAQDKWHRYARWHSAYPWLASDLTFPGTLIIIFLLGRLYARSWLDTIRGTSPFSVALFTQLTISIAYLPANNQIFLNGESLSAFWGTLFLWLWYRKAPPSSDEEPSRTLASGGQAGEEVRGNHG